jgi:hypothetical protein
VQRTIKVFMVALVVMAVVAVMAAPAFAGHAITTKNGKVVPGQNPCDNPCKDGPNGLDRANGNF